MGETRTFWETGTGKLVKVPDWVLGLYEAREEVKTHLDDIYCNELGLSIPGRLVIELTALLDALRNSKPAVAQLAEYSFGKGEVTSSNLVSGSI